MCACFSVSLSIFHGEETSLVKLEMPRTQLTQQRGPVQEVGRAPFVSSSNLPHAVLISDEAMVEM